MTGVARRFKFGRRGSAIAEEGGFVPRDLSPRSVTAEYALARERETVDRSARCLWYQCLREPLSGITP